jgi:2-desacetyl-2-hydroxyethyl bacteriochlorophyllide A dehydrogenase
MRAIVVSKPKEFGLVTLPQPQCGRSQALIHTAYCGICGTDLEILCGSIGPDYVRYPIVPGHEWTGVVVEVGHDVRNCTVGDRVSVEGYLNCGSCTHCQAGESNLCVSHEQIGFTHNGGFAEYVLAPARLCHPLPESLDLEEAVLIEPAATVVRAVERANPKPGFTGVVIGCGPIGQIALRLLGQYQPSSILAIDVSVKQQALAIRAGATAFTSNSDVQEIFDKSSGNGWDVVVDCAGGTRAMELALRIVRRGGNFVAIGGAPEHQRVSFPANIFVMQDLHVDGLFGYTTSSWRRTIELLSTGKLRLRDLITHRVALAQFEEAVNLVQSRTEPMGKVVVTYA